MTGITGCNASREQDASCKYKTQHVKFSLNEHPGIKLNKAQYLLYIQHVLYNYHTSYIKFIGSHVVIVNHNTTFKEETQQFTNGFPKLTIII